MKGISVLERVRVHRSAQGSGGMVPRTLCYIAHLRLRSRPLEANITDTIAQDGVKREFSQFCVSGVASYRCTSPMRHVLSRRGGWSHRTRPTGGFLGRSGAPENRPFMILETTR